ncbi:hypothetical protein GWK47_007375 [Chionoecetes opilio]|uniref:Uncharacterized protein n=1 Tax=Chionoecetes opilio TaxID=41210 RepID=A0A8J5CSB4_CHIOP|nr:hypothetical protein GWK47_007375 [Chionoecetes opilio]
MSEKSTLEWYRRKDQPRYERFYDGGYGGDLLFRARTKSLEHLAMSCQRGNASRTRKQKHNNSIAFKNTMHDTSKRTLSINSLEISEVCQRCQEVVAWKVKYKKYKPLSQPKTCTRCHQKNIKDAYHTVCLPCGQELQVCCKCGKKEDIVAHKAPSKIEKLQTMAELETEVKRLSERKRRTYYRFIEKLEGKVKPRKKPGNTCDDGVVRSEEKEDKEDEAPLNMDEYFRNARQKLEQLMKGMEDDDIDEEFQDLKLSSDDELEDDEEDSDEGEES